MRCPSIICCSLLAIWCPILTSGEIRGTVVDATRAPIEFANVTAFIGDSLADGAVTDLSGKFILTTANRCDRLRVSFIGYRDTLILNPANDLGEIILRQAPATLKEVVVKAPLIRREADRIILNVAANPLSAGKHAADLLKTAPGVWASDNGLSIYGQRGTTVYIDDRKVNLSGTRLVSYLSTLQASAISTIEVIPHAGNEYDADSSGGIIRINLRRNRVDGISGAAGLNTTAGEFKQWFNPFANLSLHSGRWTANFTGNLNTSPSDRYTSFEESTAPSDASRLDGVSRHKTTTIQGNMTLGLFYEPYTNGKIGLQVEYNPDSSDHHATSQTEVSGSGTAYTTLGQYSARNRSHNLDVTLNWSHRLDDKGSLLKWISSYDFRQTSVTDDNRMSYTDATPDSVYTSDASTRYNLFATEISLRKSFNPLLTLDAGVKYTFNDISFASLHHHLEGGRWIADSSHDYNHHYNEHILAAYAIMNLNTGRWRFRAGLRGEYLHTDNYSISSSRADLFPNANISFNLSENGTTSISAGYRRNIRRPSFQSLDPTVRQVSDYSYTVGNPTLSPSFTDAVSLDMLLAGKFTIAAGYSLTSAPIRQMFTSNPEYPERMYLTWGNEGREHGLFIHSDGNLNITRWWNLYASLTYMFVSRESVSAGNSDTFGYIQAVAATSFTLPAGFNLSLNCFYNSRMKIGNITVYPILNLDPTLRKQFGPHWTVTLSAENLLCREGKIRIHSSGYDRLSHTPQHPAFRLSATYTFRSGKAPRRQSIERTLDPTRLTKE